MRDDYETLLVELLAIESIASKPEKLREALELLLRLVPAGFTVERFESNGKPSALIFYGIKRPSNFEVLFNAHLDVVPAKPEQFKPYKKDGKLYARGACDMKSAALVMTLAYIDMAATAKHPTGLQLVADEELGGNDGTGYQMSQGLDASFAIIGEHTDLEINNVSKGVCMLEIIATGKTAHGAYQWQGVSAIDILLKALMNLRKVFPIFTEETWDTTMNVALLNSPNTAINALADSASAQIDFRFVPGDKRFSKTEEDLIAALMIQAKEPVEMRMIFFEPPHQVSDDNRHIKLLAKAVHDNTGQPARFVQKHGSSDIRYYSQKGIEGITFGPLCNGPHCDDECVDMAGLQTYYDILCDFLKTA